MRLATVTVLSLASFALSENTITYRLFNNCGDAMRVFKGGVDIGPIIGGKDLIKNFGIDAGPFYTTWNGGKPNGNDATRAYFWGANFYYYLVKSPVMNVEMSISTNHGGTSGFCSEATCSPTSCDATAAFSAPLTFTPPLLPVLTPPTLPLRSCPFGDVQYTITFCPHGTGPPGWQKNGQDILLLLQGDRIWCVDVQGGVLASGTPVQLYKCNGTKAQKWVIPTPAGTPGPVQLAGTSFCLDAGPNPQNGVVARIKPCVKDHPSQTWVYDDTGGVNTFSLAKKGQCLDNREGHLVNSNKLQTWQCSPGNNNNNQKWLVAL